MELKDLAPGILGNMIPESRLTDSDQAAISKNRDYLLSLTDDLVLSFYDAAFGHGPTAAVFEPGEREAREQTLRDWWIRTVSQPLDNDYFVWMTLVGVIHIRRHVKNPMMLGMLGHVVSMISDRAREDLDGPAATELIDALGRLQNVIGSLISDSYTQAYIASLEGLAGFTPELTERMLDLEIKRLADSFGSGS